MEEKLRRAWRRTEATTVKNIRRVMVVGCMSVYIIVQYPDTVQWMQSAKTETFQHENNSALACRKTSKNNERNEFLRGETETL
jgi:hypothetical protein